ncbi:MAG: peptidylprolyl isomerase [Acidobacteriia bacterium]|nr:peptidylprolyl isomerase [Terriglobia bacterium]
MKALTLFGFVCLGVAWAQTAPAPPAAPPATPPATDLPGDAVVAVFEDGAKLTVADFRSLYSILPPQYQQMAQQSREQFLRYYAMMRKMSREAEEEKLDQQSPYKEAIAFNRAIVLMQAKVSNTLNTATVPSEEIAKYYDSHQENFKEVKIKAIYVAFSSAAAPQNSSSAKAKRALTEDEARAKAQKLLAEIRGGADFVKLVRENSDDETSKARDGDLSTFRPSDNIPDAFRTVVFALKQGEVSEPVRQANGFYLLRAEDVLISPLAQVRDGIFQQLRQDRGMQWMRQMNTETKVSFPNPAFLGKPPAPAPAGK